MYKIGTKVRYSECGENGKMRLTSMINQFQDCTTEHSESLGAGIEHTREKRRAWILSSWQIVVERYPKVHDKIEISTWPTGFKGVLGPRNFCMKTPEGEMLAYANTIWVYMNLETGMPTRPDEEEKSFYEIEPPLEMEYASRKIKMPEEMKVVDTFSVRKYQIDTNSHMNNCQYVQMAVEVLPDDFEIHQVRVDYKKSAVFGDKIVVKEAMEEGRIVVELCDMEETSYAVVEFMGE